MKFGSPCRYRIDKPFVAPITSLFTAIFQWRDPDSNPGHHDFQSLINEHRRHRAAERFSEADCEQRIVLLDAPAIQYNENNYSDI
jgi:hypothetical protein